MQPTAGTLALALPLGGLALGVDAASTGTSTGSVLVYVGIGIVVLLLLLAAFLVWRCLRNRRRLRRERGMSAGAPPPLAQTYTLQMDTGGAAAADSVRNHPHHHRVHEQRVAPSAPTGYEQRQGTPPVELNAVQTADDPQSADMYYPAEAPYTDASSISQATGAGPRPTLEREFNGEDRGQSDGLGARQQDRRGSQPHQEQSDRESSSQPTDRVNGAQAAGEALEAGGASASQYARSRVLAMLESDPVLTRCRIPEFNLFFTRVLSKGAFGEVWLAHFETRKVAVKRVLSEKKSDVREIESFAAEVKLMAGFSHPKIVEFVGVCWTSVENLCAVTEYMAKGDLYSFLKVHVGHLNWGDHKIFLAEDVADALGYLHGLSPKVIHRDLKSKNVLLDNMFRAKLSDFGISRERSVEETMTAGVGTIYWTAPEVLLGRKYTEKADIYSFGIVMSELDTQKVPYSDKRDDSGKKLQGMKVLQMVIQHGVRPTLSRECPRPVRQLIERCVSADPDARPDAVELLALVRELEDELA